MLSVATTAGLARSQDFGQTWSYLRGLDWSAKSGGLLPPPAVKNAPPLEPEAEDGSLLREDYVTSLAEDAQGRLWAGFRQKGWEVRDAASDFQQQAVLSRSVPDARVKDARLAYV